MTKCKACGADIAKSVKKCPHCGADQRNFFMRHKIVTFILAIIIIGCIGSALSGGGDNKSTTTSSTSQDTKSSGSAKSTDKPKIAEKKYSYDKFMQIEMGMTYDQVKAILGDGTEESSSGEGDQKTVSYRWQNGDSSNLSVMIQGGVVTNKAQAFLQSMDAKVTMAKYNQINNGMSYNQVKNILGEGQLASQSSLLDTKSEIYEWINAGGSNMNVTFTNGAVDTKTQFELK